MKVRGSKEHREALGWAGNSEAAVELVGTREKPGSRSSVPEAGTPLRCSWPDLAQPRLSLLSSAEVDAVSPGPLGGSGLPRGCRLPPALPSQ